jgi:hypothetical protein
MLWEIVKKSQHVAYRTQVTGETIKSATQSHLEWLQAIAQACHDCGHCYSSPRYPGVHCVMPAAAGSDDLGDVPWRRDRLVQDRRLFHFLIVMDAQRRECSHVAYCGDGQ